MVRLAGMVTIGASVLGALLLLGSERWMSISYQSASAVAREAGPARGPAGGGDEAFWLSRPLRPDVQQTAAAPLPVLQARTFDVGTRVTISGSDRLSLEVVSASPTSAESGLTDAMGRPLILITARERGKGTRQVRFLVEADQAPPITEKSL